MKNIKHSSQGFAILEGVLIAVVVGIVGFTGWYVVSNRSSANKQYDKIARSDNAISVKKDSGKKVVTLESKQIAQLKETQTKTTPITTKPQSVTSNSAASPSSSTSSSPTASSGKTTASYSITISADGCTVSGYSTAGNRIEIGAFSASKGGSVVYDFSTNETITKSSGGFKGMTAYGKTVDAQGNTLAYHSAIITADSCPAAG